MHVSRIALGRLKVVLSCRHVVSCICTACEGVLGTLEICAVLQTYQGIDRCGGRLAEEVSTYVEQHPALQRISVVGHSMGGLIARYALGKLSCPARKPFLMVHASSSRSHQ